MSQVPVVMITATGNAGAGVDGSASASEKNASASASTSAYSCVHCRRRKVRCDRLSPCSTCRRASVACVYPSSTDRPPRWARRLERITNNAASNTKAPQNADPGVGEVMERLRNLESLVKELDGQLKQANATGNSTMCGSSGVNSPGSFSHDRDADHQADPPSTANTTGVQKHFGRLVLHNANQSRYVSSGFWSVVNDELHGLKMDTQSLAGGETDTSEDEDSPRQTPSTQELERTPSERHAFLFRHNLGHSAPDLRKFHPLPSQIPFLLNVYSENVNFAIQIVHVPTVTKMIRDLRGSDMTSLTPSNEALMFSIYYAAVTSMEEDDIMTNFGSTKSDLNLKYRLGLEHALAKADFLNVPNLVLVQSFTIFLFLVRRHDSPRFVWMMTGLVIRMAQALGMHRDGTRFEHLTPFEVEMRRRVWSALCMLDVRASEDQGMDLTIISGTFDTKLPLNINDADIEPETKQTPAERQGLADMSVALVSFRICDVTRQMMGLSVKEGALGLENQSRLLNEIYETLDQGYLQFATESGNIAYWVVVICARLVMAKMTLIVYLPVLFSSPSDHFSDEIRIKLLVSAIEVAEYNHTLNSEQACRHWRWLFQTYTHWHATVYLLIEIARRPWSPIVERAWVALHSSWLIPAQSNLDKNLRIWVPLRKLMAKAGKHRDGELERLRADTRAAEQLEIEDRKMPLPASSGPFPGENSADLFRERWRKLVALPEEPGNGTQPSATPSVWVPATSSVIQAVDANLGSVPAYRQDDLRLNMSLEPAYLASRSQYAGQDLTNTNSDSAMAINTHSNVALEQTLRPSYNTFPSGSGNWPGGQPMGPDFMSWLWADTDPSVDVFADIDVNMDLDGEVDWYNLVESAKGIEWNSGLSGYGRI